MESLANYKTQIYLNISRIKSQTLQKITKNIGKIKSKYILVVETV